jgi:hypothetical protein
MDERDEVLIRVEADELVITHIQRVPYPHLDFDLPFLRSRQTERVAVTAEAGPGSGFYGEEEGE